MKTGIGAEHIREVFQSYVDRLSAGDIDGIVELFAEGAALEDPIGSPVQRGRAAIRAFYEASKGAATLRLDGRVRTAGNEGACAMIATPNAATGSSSTRWM
jgi:steroid delta-isomerase